jgi:hypothetical protein
MDRPTENPASKALPDCCVVTYCWVTMEIKSTNRCIATDMCWLSLMWEVPTNSSPKQHALECSSKYSGVLCIVNSAWISELFILSPVAGRRGERNLKIIHVIIYHVAQKLNTQ